LVLPSYVMLDARCSMLDDWGSLQASSIEHQASSITHHDSF
jgi:hypothetical protein